MNDSTVTQIIRCPGCGNDIGHKRFVSQQYDWTIDIPDGVIVDYVYTSTDKRLIHEAQEALEKIEARISYDV